MTVLIISKDWKASRDEIVRGFKIEQENSVKDDPEYVEYLRLKNRFEGT